MRVSLFRLSYYDLYMRRWYLGWLLRDNPSYERIIVDEGHDMQEGVKARIEEVWDRLGEALFAHKAQIIILTGTLPRYLIDAYQKQLQRDDMNIIREPSDRRNNAYHSVVAYARSSFESYHYGDITEQLIVNLTRHIEQSSTPDDRILVFFPSRDVVEAFGTAHNYLWYHSRCTKSAMADTLESWDRHDYRVLIATTAMAQGLDRRLRYVIAANVVYGITTIAQMMGRAGRDGQPSDMIFIGPPTVPLDVDVPWHEDSILAQHQLHTTTTCQREVMMTSLDGPSNTYQCLINGSTAVDIHPCGICAPQSPVHLLALQAVETARRAYTARSRRVSIPATRAVTASRNPFQRRVSTAISTDRAPTSRRINENAKSVREGSSSVKSWSSQLAQEREERRENPRYSHSGDAEQDQDISIEVRLLSNPTTSLMTDTPWRERQPKPWKTLSDHGSVLPEAVIRALDKLPIKRAAAQRVRCID